MSISFTIYSLQLSSLFFPPSLVIYLFLYPTLFFFLKHFTLCRITSLTLYPFNFFSFSHLHLQRQLIFRGCATSHALRNAAGRRCAALGTSAQCRTPVAPVFFFCFFCGCAASHALHDAAGRRCAARNTASRREAQNTYGARRLRRKVPAAQGACSAKRLRRKAPATHGACGARFILFFFSWTRRESRFA